MESGKKLPSRAYDFTTYKRLIRIIRVYDL